MKILIDLFVTAPHLLDEMLPQEKKVFQTIIDFFEQRLNPLKNQIDAEELVNPKSHLMIHFLHKNDKKRVSTSGYSAHLTEKINGCFSTEDFIFLNDKIDRLSS